MIYKLEQEVIHEFAVKRLSEEIDLEMKGYRLTNEIGWDVLLKAASTGQSITGASEELTGVVHHNTLRGQLNERFSVTELNEQELAQNRVLGATIPQHLRGSSVEIAIDIHDEPMYSKDAVSRVYGCRGRAHQGTTHFWRLASAYVMKANQRVTVALMYVLPEHSLLDIVCRLLHRVQQQQIGIRCVYMDREFCTTAIIRYLTQADIPAIIACPIRGKSGGTRALCHQRASYSTSYTFSDGTTTTIACVRTYPHGKSGRRRLKWLLFVTIGVNWPPKKIKQRYRRRFGIETSYRLMRLLRIYSTSRNPALRFFLLGLAFILLNIWTFICWTCTRHPGTRVVYRQWFHLTRFKAFLRRVIETLYDPVLFLPSFIPAYVLKL